MAPQVLPKVLGAVERDLLIFGPYFVPGEHGVMMLTYVKDPETGAFTRFFVSLVSLLPIEGQL